MKKFKRRLIIEDGQVKGGYVIGVTPVPKNEMPSEKEIEQVLKAGEPLHKDLNERDSKKVLKGTPGWEEHMKDYDMEKKAVEGGLKSGQLFNKGRDSINREKQAKASVLNNYVETLYKEFSTKHPNASVANAAQHIYRNANDPRLSSVEAVRMRIRQILKK